MKVYDWSKGGRQRRRGHRGHGPDAVRADANLGEAEVLHALGLVEEGPALAHVGLPELGRRGRAVASHLRVQLLCACGAALDELLMARGDAPAPLELHSHTRAAGRLAVASSDHLVLACSRGGERGGRVPIVGVSLGARFWRIVLLRPRSVT